MTARVNGLSGDINADEAPHVQIGRRMVHPMETGSPRRKVGPVNQQSADRNEGMSKSMRDELTELSKQVVQLQFQLSLALLKLKQRPLQQQQPTNDNWAA